MNRQQRRKQNRQKRSGKTAAVLEKNLQQAMDQHRRGQLAAAATGYRKILEIHPHHAQTLNIAGVLSAQTGRNEEALERFRLASVQDPTMVPAHFNLAQALLETGDFKAAEQSFLQTLTLDPDHPHAHANLAALYERLSRLTEARRQVEKTPGHPLARLTLARIERRQNRFQEGLDSINTIVMQPLDAQTRSDIFFERGRIQDRLQRFEASYDDFVAANRELAAVWSGMDRKIYPRRIERLRAVITSEKIKTWPTPSANPGPTPIFLVGFPRSGTTLLDRILGCHPQLRSLEERYLLRDVCREHGIHPDTLPNHINRLTNLDLEQMRHLYWRLAAQYLSSPLETTERLLDKLPLNIVEAGLIHRLFPNAPFLFALRHPADVCLSCLMQPFAPNQAMIHFTTLEDTVRLYVQVMALWQQYRSLLSLKIHTVRYESVVESFEESIGGVLDFLNLPWDDKVRNYYQHTHGQQINTPSYHQVSQPLYNHACGRWKNHRRPLQPFWPLLEPFIQAFDYANDTKCG